MNFQDILVAEIQKTRNAYNNGLITKDEIAVRMPRLVSLRAISAKLQNKKDKRRSVIKTAMYYLDMARRGISSDASFLAIDTGFDRETKSILQEVGLTFMKNGIINTITYIVKGQEEGRDVAGSIIAPEREIKKIVQQMYNDADYAIFHNCAADLKLLGLTTINTKYLDTSIISQLWFPHNFASLFDLCKHYNIDPTGIHHSGIDSRLTLDVLRSMTIDQHKPVRAFKFDC